MKTWKIIKVAAFALIAVALMTTTAFAMPCGNSGPAPVQGSTGNMMHGSASGPMHNGYPWMAGYRRCLMRKGFNLL